MAWSDMTQAILDRTNGLHVEAPAHERALKLVTGLRDPSLAELKRHVDKRGPDGVLESAMHLSEAQFKQLAIHVEQARKGGKR